MATTSKIFIGIDNNKIELTGADKEAFLEQRVKDEAEALLLETEYKAKQKSREDAIKKLAKVAGLTAEELESIL
jgi:hypothetical protein